MSITNTFLNSSKGTTYDASYLELAMRLGLPLATQNSELQKAATQVGVNVSYESNVR